MPAVTRLDLFQVALPLRKTIRHASHERLASDSLVARVTLGDGSVGFGEGVPRSYVTGETIETAFDALTSLDVASQVGNPGDFAAAVSGISELRVPSIDDDPRGMFGNAARAALEIALIDAYGHAFGESAGRAIRLASRVPELLTPAAAWVRYSGAITAETPGKEIRSAGKMWLNNFRHVKLKVGVAGQDDAKRLRRIRAVLGPKIDVRLDANEAWSPDEVVDRMAALRPSRPSTIEQPVPHAQVESLAEMRPRLGVPVMLDESLCGYPDAVRSVESGTADLFNVRISKCGGLIPSLRLIELAHRHGIGVQLGCHPGESGLLSAAGRHLASNVRGLRYVEGSYDRHLLGRNITRDDPTFGFGGWAAPIKGPGLGVRIDDAALNAMTVDRREVRYD
ncbi:MAG TPA: enolase C-terminal domain-like protein [Isosphaeraceae bacterium]|jgi:muconate cycloisomerase